MRNVIFISLFLLSFSANSQVQVITPVQIASNIEAPVAIEHAGDNSGRLFIGQQVGRILIWRNGSVLDTPFLDISDRISCCQERGLLGIAFHPDFASNGEFFVNYTNLSFATVVSRFTVSTDPNQANASSEEILLTVAQPFSNHNGGHLAFGPDGYLYIGLGDGGSGGDPDNYAQNHLSLLGKMLRIDVDNGSPYAIPDDNPFAHTDFTLDEIWALGLRNPFRYSFDRITGDLYIADVGQDLIEEVHVHRANTASGENYGWRLMEGTSCFNPATGCNDGSLTLPAFEYTHTNGRCSITGGYVYRGIAIPALQGKYLYGDFCTGEIFSAEQIDQQWQQTVLLDTDFDISSFGQDQNGELFVADLSGSFYQLVAPLAISPADGLFLENQSIDLVILSRISSPIASISLTANGVDVSSQFDSCAIGSALDQQGQALRCPGIALSVLGSGEHTITATATFSNGSSASASVGWHVLSVQESP